MKEKECEEEKITDLRVWAFTGKEGKIAEKMAVKESYHFIEEKPLKNY